MLSVLENTFIRSIRRGFFRSTIHMGTTFWFNVEVHALCDMWTVSTLPSTCLSLGYFEIMADIW